MPPAPRTCHPSSADRTSSGRGAEISGPNPDSPRRFRCKFARKTTETSRSPTPTSRQSPVQQNRAVVGAVQPSVGRRTGAGAGWDPDDRLADGERRAAREIPGPLDPGHSPADLVVEDVAGLHPLGVRASHRGELLVLLVAVQPVGLAPVVDPAVDLRGDRDLLAGLGLGRTRVRGRGCGACSPPDPGRESPRTRRELSSDRSRTAEDSEALAAAKLGSHGVAAAQPGNGEPFTVPIPTSRHWRQAGRAVQRTGEPSGECRLGPLRAAPKRSPRRRPGRRPVAHSPCQDALARAFPPSRWENEFPVCHPFGTA